MLTGDGQRGGLNDGVGLDSLSEGGWAWADRDVGGNGGGDPDIDGLAGNWSVDGDGSCGADSVDDDSWSIDGSSDGSRAGCDLSVGRGVHESDRSVSRG